MATTAHDADAAFFNLMHYYVTCPYKGNVAIGIENDERRAESRRAFRIKQRIAPGYCWEVPPESAWIEVLCYDLTQGGFSFLLDKKPDFERLVAMFRSTAPIYVAARVNQCRPVLADDCGGVLEPAVTPQRRTARRPADGCEVLRGLPIPAAVQRSIMDSAWGHPTLDGRK